MSIYNKSGQAIGTAFNKGGEALSIAYDVDGTPVFSDGQSLTVMSFNVGCFYSEWHTAPTSTGDVFYLRNKGILERHNPDYAGMSEWHNQIGTVQASTLMNEFFESYYPYYDAYSVDGAALTSAFTGTAANVTNTAYTAQDSNTRYYQKAYINLAGKTICCILTHLALTPATRAAQFLELMGVVANEQYFIITGDFNFEIVSVGDSEYNASVQVALDRGYNSAQNAEHLLMTWYSGETVAASTRIFALDNIITSANIIIDSVFRDETKLTDGLCEEYGIIIDHLPLIATLTFAESEAE